MKLNSLKNAFVTGATGFIGTHLVRELLASNVNVTCLARKTSDISALTELCEQNENCSIIFADLLDPGEALEKALAECETVFHLAAATMAIRSADLVDINLKSMQHLLDACVAQ